MPQEALTEDQVLDHLDALREKFDAIEFECRMNGEDPNPYIGLRRVSSLRLTASTVRIRIESEDGLTALNRLRWDGFVQELAEGGLTLDAGEWGYPTPRFLPAWAARAEASWEENRLRRELRDVRRILGEERAFWFPGDEEIEAALRRAYDGAPVTSTQVAAEMGGGTTEVPHSVAIRVGLALARLAAFGRSVRCESKSASAPNKWTPAVAHDRMPT